MDDFGISHVVKVDNDLSNIDAAEGLSDGDNIMNINVLNYFNWTIRNMR